MADPEQKLSEQDRDAARAGAIDVVVAEAQRRFAYVQAWESDARKLFWEDYKFANGDSDNNYQWPDEIISDRTGAPGSDQSSLPCLTINKTRQHNKQIVNDAQKNKPGIKYSPVGNEATLESAGVLNGLARHVEQQSNAAATYDKATDFMVQGGFGFWRVNTEFQDNESFNQEIYIRPIVNPANAWLDPNAIQPDKIDAKWGFVVEDIAREYFEAKYPKFKDYINQEPFDGVSATWYSDQTVRVAEYYRLTGKADTLWAYIPDGANAPVFIKESLLQGELLTKVKTSQGARSRPIMVEQLEWYFLVGNKIADKRLDMPGKYVPLVKIAGEETVIDGKYDCKSHTRALKDPQRMYNYWASSGVQFGALQTKTPWIASKESIEGNEKDWNAANVMNKSVLLYNALADDGMTVIPPPQRIQPPVSAPVALDGMKIASEEMMSVSGQYQAMMGAPSNERSGKAINERQRQGETATYHYINAVALGVRKTGKICLDLFSLIYDNQRVIQILQEDGKTLEIQIDPKAQKAYEELQQENSMAITRVLNPSIGSYEVVVDVGPSFATKREEAFNAFMGLLGQAPQLIPILGDVLFRNADFPMSEEAAERLKRMVPSYVLGDGPTPNEQQLMQQTQNLKAMLGKLMQEKAVADIKLKGKDQQKVIDLMNAITQRLKLFVPKPNAQGEIPPEQLHEIVASAVQNVFSTPVDDVGGASEPDLQQAAGDGASQLNLPLNPAPFPGAKQGVDGKWYGRDFSQMRNYRPVGGLQA